MNTPTPQLTEEVKPPYKISERKPVWPCWLYSTHHDFWSKHDYWGPLAGPEEHGWTHWHPDQPTAPTVTPYLAPRPPAPVDAEWAKRANEAIAGIDYAMDWKNNSPSAVEFATGLAAARQFIIDARHAPADSASAQLAAMREERDALAKLYRRDYGHDYNHNAKYEGL